MKKTKIFTLCGLVLALSGCDQKGFQVGTSSEQAQTVENKAEIDRNKTISKSDVEVISIDKPMLPFIYSTLKEYAKTRNFRFPAGMCYRYIGNNYAYLDKSELELIYKMYKLDKENLPPFRDAFNGYIQSYEKAIENGDFEAILEIESREYSGKALKDFQAKKAEMIKGDKKELEKKLEKGKEYMKFEFGEDFKNFKVDCVLLGLNDFTKPSMNTLWDGWLFNDKNKRDATFFFDNTHVYGVALAEMLSSIADELSSKPNKTEKEYREMIIEMLSRKDMLDIFTSKFEEVAHGEMKLNVDRTGKSRSYMINGDTLIVQDGKGTTIQMNGVTWLGDGNTIKGKNYMLKTVRSQEQTMQKQKSLSEKGGAQGQDSNSSKVEN
jgi:lipoprotein